MISQLTLGSGTMIKNQDHRYKFQRSRRHTNSVRLGRVEHGGGGRDEREQLGVPPLVSGQIPPGIDHLKTDQSIWQGLEERKEGKRREERQRGERETGGETGGKEEKRKGENTKYFYCGTLVNHHTSPYCISLCKLVAVVYKQLQWRCLDFSHITLFSL